MDKIGVSLILLTYKRKILLMHRDNSPIIKSAWCFIEGEKEKNKSFEESMFRKVEKETSLKLTAATLVANWMYNNETKCFYHAELTDEHVNNIKREEGQTLDFFTFREVEKLALTVSAAAFVTKYKDFLARNA